MSPTGITTPHLDKTIATMDHHIQTMARREDRRERFLLMYRTFKGELRRNLQEGRFLDSDWSEAICCRMGEMYFEALDAYENDLEACPEAWVVAFDFARNRETNLLQDALLGMNAHINYDLTVCVYDVMHQKGDFDSALLKGKSASGVDRTLNSLLKKRYFDYLLINQIAWESIPLIQDVLTKRFSWILGLLNKASFRFSKALVEKLILDYRDRAWTHALLLLSASNDQEHRQVRSFMDDLAVSNTNLIRAFVSYNPLKLLRPALDPETIDQHSEKVLSPVIAELLKQKLVTRETSEYAARTFVEYGNAAVPYLDHQLEQNPENTYLVKDIYGILGKIGTEGSAEVLIQQLKENEPNPDLLKALWRHDAVILRDHMSADLLDGHLANALKAHYQNRHFLKELEDYPSDSIVMRTLRDRRDSARMRWSLVMKLAAVIRGYSKDQLESVNSSIACTNDDTLQLLSDAILGGEEAVYQTRAQKRFGLTELPLEERIRYWNTRDDVWLISCFHVDGNRNLLEPSLLANLSDEDPSMISTVEKVLYLKNVALFNEIPAEELTSIAKVATEHSFDSGEYLIREGNPGRDLFIMKRGTVHVIKDDTIVTELVEGDVLGEISLLTESDASADCIAASPVDTLQINQKDFLDFLYEGYPEIALGLIKVLMQRLEQTTEQLNIVPVK